MPGYSEDPAWADVVPLPQDDGSSHPLAAIAYAPEYVEAMSYLRAVMSQNEFSERVLELTEEVIEMNPAHYTVWLYRANCIFALESDLHQELNWLNETALANLKNYQIWHHRQSIVERIASKLEPRSPDWEQLMRDESDFVGLMFSKDAKNYHVWSYRQWMVKRFGQWDSPRELDFIETMLQKDVRNNSAWNHRWFVQFGRPNAPSDAEKDKEVMDREIAYAEDKIRLAPQNQSPWNYLKGVVAHFKIPLSVAKDFASEFASLDMVDEVRSSHALAVLAEIYREEQKREEAEQALELLAKRYDPIRSKYWMWKKQQLGAAAA